MKRAVRARHKEVKLKKVESELGTPDFSEKHFEIKKEFDAIFENDYVFMKQDG